MSPFPFLQVAIAGILSLSPVLAGGWSADYEAARKRAAAERKDLLIDFTGSDWCAWCIRLKEEVFDHEAFSAGVKDRYVLVELDYPKDKGRLPEATARQNEELLKKYPIKGYPSVLLCDASGRPYALAAYRPGGPPAYLEHLAELQQRKTRRDRAFADAERVEGVQKAKLLLSALDALELEPEMIREWYGPECRRIKEADPEDETGFAKREAAAEVFSSFMAKLMDLRSKQDLEGAVKLAEETLKHPLAKGDLRIQVFGHYAGTLAYAGKKDEAIAVLKRAIADVDEGEKKEELKKFIEVLEREKAGLPPAK